MSREPHGQRGVEPVVLVCMPFAPVMRPSIALGILKAALAPGGRTARVLYPNLWFAELIGPDLYDHISSLAFAPDMIFSHLAAPDCGELSVERFREMTRPYAEGLAPALVRRLIRSYVELPAGLGGDSEVRVIRERCAETFGRFERGECTSADLVVETLASVKELAAGFVSRVADRVTAVPTRIVGCTTCTGQHTASLALLAELKRRDPSTVTLLGGSSCEGAMGISTAEHFAQVDYVVSGEADELFPRLIELLDAHGTDAPVSKLPHGVISCDSNVPPESWEGYRAQVPSMDWVPAPDYDDYFDSLRESPLSINIAPALLVEGARGCWWGQKSPCAFCGLGGSAGFEYRAKPAGVVFEEILALARRHWIGRVELVDNILDRSYQHTLLPALEGLEPRLSLFAEVRANIGEDELRRLAGAGVDQVQPGIESLSDRLLKLMNKGTTVLMNVRFLRTAAELGLSVIWPLLKRIPGERDEDYLEMAERLPLLHHFPPPTTVQDIEFSRHGAYCRAPEEYGLKLAPARQYSAIYPAGAIPGMAHTFEWRNAPEPGPGHGRFEQAVLDWVAAHEGVNERPALRIVGDDESQLVLDTRRRGSGIVYSLGQVERSILRLARSPVRLLALRRRAEAALGEQRGVPDACDQLVSRGLLLVVDDSCVSLVMERADRREQRAPCGGFHTPFTRTSVVSGPLSAAAAARSRTEEQQ
jgi:ribosomal peptide maturation radical SAM protein 1